MTTRPICHSDMAFSPDQRDVLEQIANAQADALDRFMADLRGEPFPVPYTPTYARHGCGLCGNTGRIDNDIPCTCEASCL